MNDIAAEEQLHANIRLMLPSGQGWNIFQLHHNTDRMFDDIGNVDDEFFMNTTEELATEEECINLSKNAETSLKEEKRKKIL